VLIPSTHEKGELVIDGREEKIVKKPYMVSIVDIETMMEFKKCEIVAPCCTDLGSNIDPKPFNPYIMDASELDVSERSWVNRYIPAPNI
jgi:hypothetical protein